MHRSLPFWLAVLTVVLVADVTFPCWTPAVAAFVKARHGWFDSPRPLEPDRGIENVSVAPAAIGPDGSRYISTGALVIAAAPEAPAVRWSAAVDRAKDLVVGPAGVLYVAAARHVLALDARTGATRWGVVAQDRPAETNDLTYGDWRGRWDVDHLALDSEGRLWASGHASAASTQTERPAGR
jgi:hypothetical protein